MKAREAGRIFGVEMGRRAAGLDVMLELNKLYSAVSTVVDRSYGLAREIWKEGISGDEAKRVG